MRASSIRAAALLAAIAMTTAPEAFVEAAPKPKRPVEDDEERLAEAKAKRDRKAAKRAAQRKTP